MQNGWPTGCFLPIRCKPNGWISQTVILLPSRGNAGTDVHRLPFALPPGPDCEEDEGDYGADSHFNGGFTGMRRVPILVVEGCGAAAYHFQTRHFCGPVDEFTVQVGFYLPDVVQPVVQRQVLVYSAQQHHGCVRVHIHEAGNDGFAAAVHYFGSGYVDMFTAYLGNAPAVHKNVCGLVMQGDVTEQNHSVGTGSKKPAGRAGFVR